MKFRIYSEMDIHDVTKEEEEKPPTPPTFEGMFKLFSNLAEPEGDGTRITLTGSNRWMKHAKILDGKKVRETDTGRTFFSFKRRSISFNSYMEFLSELCEKKGMNFENVKQTMTECGDPRQHTHFKADDKSKAKDTEARKSGAAPERASIIEQLRSKGVGLSKKEKKEEEERRKEEKNK